MSGRGCIGVRGKVWCDGGRLDVKRGGKGDL